MYGLSNSVRQVRFHGLRIHLEIDGSKPLNEVEMLLLNTEMTVKSNIPGMGAVVVIPHSKLRKF